MARGLARIARVTEEKKASRDARDAQRQSGDVEYQNPLVLQPGETATGRFCEDGDNVEELNTHNLFLAPGQKIADKVLCLKQEDTPDEPCFACEHALDMEIKSGTRIVMNFIRYDEPKLERDANGRAIKLGPKEYKYEMTTDPTTGQPVRVTENALVIFQTGSTISTRLHYLETQKGPLSNHVVTIARTHDNTNPFMIDIKDADKPPSDEEKAIYAKKLPPLKAIQALPGKRAIPFMSYNDMARAYGGSVSSGFSSGAAPTGNPYTDAANQAGGTINRGAFSN